MGRAQARPPFTLYCYRPPGAASGQPRPTGRQAASQTPLPGRPPPQTTSAPGPTPGTAHQARPRSQAGQVLLPADWEACAARRVRPGVTAATPLTLAAASHWLAGPSLGLMHRQYRCHYRARPRERQALIRECLGQNSQSPPRWRTDNCPLTLSQENLSHHSTPFLDLLHLGSPLCPQVVIKSRTAKHRLLADHLLDRLTRQEITRLALYCSSISVYSLPSFGLVISLILLCITT